MKQKRADRRAAVNEAVIEISTENPAEPLPTSEQPPRFVGRSRGVIHISDQDLISPIGEDWEVDADLSSLG